MNNGFCLNTDFSTTKLIQCSLPQIRNQASDSFETVLFLPPKEGRKYEGGLRTRGYFKKSHEGKPLISIITVVFNGDKHLENTLKSVLYQTYDNIEYIVIDGGSSDGTLDIIHRYDHALDYWVSEKDMGIYDAMNKGISLTTGDLVGIVHSDDWYELDAINLVASHFNNNHVLHGAMRIFHNEKYLFTSSFSGDYSPLYKGMIINHPTVFVPKSIYKQHGLFETRYKIASDWDLMLRLFKKNISLCYISEIIANFRLGGTSYELSLASIREKHSIRAKNRTYSFVDIYFIIDIIKYLVFGNMAMKFSIYKQWFISKYIKNRGFRSLPH